MSILCTGASWCTLHRMLVRSQNVKPRQVQYLPLLNRRNPTTYHQKLQISSLQWIFFESHVVLYGLTILRLADQPQRQDAAASVEQYCIKYYNQHKFKFPCLKKSAPSNYRQPEN